LKNQVLGMILVLAPRLSMWFDEVNIVSTKA